MAAIIVFMYEIMLTPNNVRDFPKTIGKVAFYKKHNDRFIAITFYKHRKMRSRNYVAKYSKDQMLDFY